MPEPHEPLCPRAVLYIRYRDDSIDWEETCIQFQDCKALVARVRYEFGIASKPRPPGVFCCLKAERD